MTITIRQKALANDNISLYLDIYDGGKRKFEFLSLYLLPEVDAETKARNEETLQRAHQIRAERILHPETIPEVGHLMIVKEIPNDESPEVLDWIQTYIDWMSDNTDYSKAIVDQSKYLKYLMSEFLANKRRPHITLRKFDKEWFKAFFLWLKNDYVPQKYVRVEAKPAADAESTVGDHWITALPSISIPRRPARPVSCVYSPGVIGTWDSPLYLINFSKTTVRAGILIPSARVSVAKTALIRPF